MPPINRFERSCIAAVLAQTIATPAVQASVVTVNAAIDSPNDGCTLIEAIQTVETGIGSDPGAQEIGGCIRVESGNTTRNRIELPANSTQSLTAGFAGNPNLFTGLPLIRSEFSIRGNGSTIQRAPGSADFRLFGILGEGRLALSDITLSGGKLDNFGGGAIYVAAGADLDLEFDAVITGNSAENGGAIFSLGAVNLFNDSQITGNSASLNGGGIYLKNETGDARLLSPNVSINNNTATNGGGVAVSEGASLDLFRGVISNNTAQNSGGGIAVENAVLSGSGGTIQGNSATTFGGGISLYAESSVNSIIRIRSITVSGNSALSGGGVMVNAETGAVFSLQLQDSEVVSNNANFGAGLFARKSDLNISDSSISGNSASNSGGGIRLFFSNAEIDRSTIFDNTAPSGGGIYSSSVNRVVEIVNSTLSANSSSRGAAINNNVSTIELTNSTVFANYSEDNGSAIYSTRTTDLIFQNSIVAGSNGPNCELLDDFGGVPLNLQLDRSNIIDDSSCGTMVRQVDPKLLPLANNGGTTLTHLPDTNSPAIGNGNRTACNGDLVQSLDQRGEIRSNTDCSIGAVELPFQQQMFVVPLPNGKSVVFGL